MHPSDPGVVVALVAAPCSSVSADRTTPSAQVVSLRHYRLARKIAEAGRNQGELAHQLRVAGEERERLAEALRGAQNRLAGIAEGYRRLLQRLERERSFRDACREALELDDLDEMIRRRDELADRLRTLRRDDERRRTDG